MDAAIIQQKIFEIREQKVILDYDLANLYSVETRILNQAVKRNAERFPIDFMFRLTKEEWGKMRSNIVIVSEEAPANSSHFVMSSRKHRGALYLPYAFTEHGITMLASVLRSEVAVKMNVAIVRAFIALRNIAYNYKELAIKLGELEQHSNKHFEDIYKALNYLIDKKQKEQNFSERERIGFKK